MNLDFTKLGGLIPAIIHPGVCHEGYRSCFFRRLSPSGASKVIAERTFDPTAVYGKDARR